LSGITSWRNEDPNGDPIDRAAADQAWEWIEETIRGTISVGKKRGKTPRLIFYLKSCLIERFFFVFLSPHKRWLCNKQIISFIPDLFCL